MDLLNLIGITNINDKLYEYIYAAEVSKFLNFTNQRDIPEDALNLISRMATSEYLKDSFQLNDLPDGLNLEFAASKIAIGDTSIDFSGDMSDTEKFLGFLNSMSGNWKIEALRWRRFRW